MSLLSGWKAWREFRRLPWAWRNIVIYSESGQDWHHFSPLIEELNGDGATIVVITHNHEIADHFPRKIALRDGRIEADEVTP